MPEENKYDYLADFYTTVELELNNVNHCGVPLGPLLSRYFIDSFRKNVYKFPIDSALKNIYQIVRYFLLSINSKELKKANKLSKERPPKYIIAKIDNGQERGNKLFRDLLDKCSPHILYTRYNRNINRDISIPVIQFEWGYISFPEAFNVVFRCIKSANIVYKKLKKRADITVPYLEVVLNVFFTTLQLNAWERFFKKNKPEAVLTDYDRINPELVLSAIKNNIRTATLVHGIIDKRYGYYPVLADNIFCWGKGQRDFFISKGIDEKRIKITGNPIAEGFQMLPAQDVLLKYNIDNSPGYNIVGLVLSMIEIGQNIDLIKISLDALDEHSFLIVKLHPSDKQQNIFEENFKDHKNIFISSSISFQEFISVIKCCILQNSGTGNELIVCNMPVLFLNNDGSMAHSAYYPFFKDYFYSNTCEIKKELSALLSSTEYYEKMQRDQRNILTENIFYRVGQEAANENATQLKMMAQ